MLDLSLAALLACAIAVAVGALVQGTVGFGLALIAAPVMILVEPALVPAGMLVVSGVMPWTTLAQEWREVDWGGLGWTMPGRVVGTVAGVWLVGALSQDGISVAVALFVLLSVAASLSGWHVRITRPRLLVAGTLGGIGGTATAIGGPPLAVLYQHQRGPTVRATLAAFFAIGQILSLSSLLLAGVVDPRSVGTGAVLVPALFVGVWAARRLRGHLDAGRTRPAVLLVSGASAVVLLVRVAL